MRKRGNAMARATLVSGVQSEDGKYDLYLEPVAYTALAPWGSDANPDIPANEKGWLSKGKFEYERLAKLLGWRESPDIGVDGVYIDSMEGWGETHQLPQGALEGHAVSNDVRSEHQARRPVEFLGNVFVRIGSVARFAQSRSPADGKRRVLPLLVPRPARGHARTGVHWIEKGKFTPTTDDRYLFLRSMSYKRPYMMLMNNAFEDPKFMEAYFQRSLFYAVFPSMFQAHAAIGEVPYFQNPSGTTAIGRCSRNTSR
jgi:hypothetical protein